MKTYKNFFKIIGSGLFAVAAVCASTIPASAKPAMRGYHEIEQPDGTTVTVQLIGDEHSHVMLTKDGYSVRRNKDGFYVYTQQDEAGYRKNTNVVARDAQWRTAADVVMLKNIKKYVSSEMSADAPKKESPMRGPGLCTTSFPSKGAQKGLIILVEYTDVKFGSKNSSAYNYSKYATGSDAAHKYWSDLVGKEGFNGFGSNGSCRDWFLDNSRNSEGNVQFDPTFDVFGPVTLAHNMAYYGENDSYTEEDMRPEEMVIEACKLLDSQINFADYDRDGDGYVDNVYVFYAGYGEADYGGDDTVWPHSWALSGARKAFKLDGVWIDHYACSNETVKFSRRPDGIGTFIHEFSHVMGLPDLYCTSQYANPLTPNEYSVMDYGPYNNDGLTPPNYSAYERYALDWIAPVEFGLAAEVTLPSIDKHNDAYIVKTEKANEYYLVENRQQNGWDSYLPGHGMLIWHVDFDVNVFNSNRVNNTTSHQYVDLIEANGKTNVNYYEQYKAGYPFPGTSNVTSYTFKSWANKDCGVLLSGIKEDGENIVMQAQNINSSDIQIMTDEKSEAPIYYNLQGVRIMNPKSGEFVIKRVGSKSKKIVF